MNTNQKKYFDKFLSDSDDLFHDEIKTDENRDYRRGYYAGRLHAALAIKNMLSANQGDDMVRIDFYE